MQQTGQKKPEGNPVRPLSFIAFTLNSVLSEMKLHNILANSSCVWLCPSFGLSSVTDLLPEASLDKQNSFSSLESLSPELFFATSSSNGTNHGSSNGANNRTNDKSCKPSSHHRQALSFSSKRFHDSRIKPVV